MEASNCDDRGAHLRALARESYEELVGFASEQLGRLRETKGGEPEMRAAAASLVSEITSEVAAETAAETAAEAMSQMGIQPQKD